MKKFTYFLTPVAVLVLFGACSTAILGFLVILMTSLGFGEWLPVLYYWQFNVAALSVALPIVGMVLFAAILLGISGNRGEEIKPAVIESSSKQEVTGEGKKEDHRLKAA